MEELANFFVLALVWFAKAIIFVLFYVMFIGVFLGLFKLALRMGAALARYLARSQEDVIEGQWKEVKS
jgi:hypothetical protein